MPRLKKIRTPRMKPAHAQELLKWLFGRVKVSPNQFTKEDCCFAEALLVEMLVPSFEKGDMEALKKSSVKIPSGPRKAVSTFLKGPGKSHFKIKKKEDRDQMIADPMIDKGVMGKVSRNFKKVWKTREDTETLKY